MNIKSMLNSNQMNSMSNNPGGMNQIGMFIGGKKHQQEKSVLSKS